MPADRNKVIRISFYTIWLIVSLIQAHYTELLADEAYYWKYAQDLQWGYFDHPPMIAVFIKAGYALFQNEIGVRLLSIIAIMGTIYLLELITRPKQLLYFYLTITSIGALHILSFLALPDVPLLFFSTLYLYLYERYLDKDKLFISGLLAICIALMLLSKYHGILIIAFSIIAYPAIIKRTSFWLIAIGSLLLYIPHLQWQLAHNFPSVSYHLSERYAESYKIDHTLNYLASIFIIFSPVAGVLLAYTALRKKPTAIYERTLYIILSGSLLFFFIMSFRGRTEANWIVAAILPAIILGYKLYEEQVWFSKFIRISFAITLFIIIPIRILLVHDYLPDIPQLFQAKNKIHHTKQWAKLIQEKAGDKPVIFMNKYQYPAWYEYYTGKKAISLNNRLGRKNQYNILDDEYNLQGKDVMIVPNYRIENTEYIITSKDSFQYFFQDNFRSASCVRITTFKDEYQVKPSEQIQLQFQIYAAGDSSWDITNNPNTLPYLHIMIFKDGKFIEDRATDFQLQNEMLEYNSSRSYTTTFTAPDTTGNYTIYLDVAMGKLPPSINGNAIELTVK